MASRVVAPRRGAERAAVDRVGGAMGVYVEPPSTLCRFVPAHDPLRVASRIVGLEGPGTGSGAHGDPGPTLASRVRSYVWSQEGLTRVNEVWIIGPSNKTSPDRRRTADAPIWLPSPDTKAILLSSGIPCLLPVSMPT